MSNKVNDGGSIFDGSNPISADKHLPLFLVQTIVIISLTRILGYFFRKIHQPRVIAEVIGGILLGPSAFGRIPMFTKTLFPPESVAYLKLVADVFLIFFLFLVGLELDPSMLLKNARQSSFISIAGIALPFSLGIAVSSALYNLLMPQPSPIPFPSFFLFLGVAMSITAFPVLARILTEKKLLTTPVGVTTISAAAVDDFVSWCFLALVIAIINSTSGLNAFYTFLLVVAHAALLFFGVRPLLSRLLAWSSSSESLSEFVVFLTFVLVLVSAFITEIIGVHAIFGAFLVGVIIPHDGGFAVKLTEKIEDLVTIVFLPLYFAFSGLKTNISLIDSWVTVGLMFVVIAAACFGKLVGCTVASKLSGLDWRESVTVGVLMNTKGLVELIVLNLGLDAGVINPRIFVVMVMMAIVTTVMTSPLVSWIYTSKYKIGEENLQHELDCITSTDGHATQDQPAPSIAQGMKIVVCLETMDSVATLMHFVQMLQHYHQYYPDRSLLIHALRLIELTERTSAVMKVAEGNKTMNFDPVVNVFKTFGNLNAIRVHPLLSVSEIEDFGHNIVSYASSLEANFILLPWLLQESMGLEQFLDNATGRKKQHKEMVSFVLKHSTVTVGVLLDHGFAMFSQAGPVTPISQAMPTLFLPYLGGDDDREALLVLLRLAAGRSYKVVVCRIKYGLVEQKISSHDSMLAGSPEKTPQSTNLTPSTKYQSTGVLSSVTQTRNRKKDESSTPTKNVNPRSPSLSPVKSPKTPPPIDSPSPNTIVSPTSELPSYLTSPANADDRALHYFYQQSRSFSNVVIEDYESPYPHNTAIQRSLQFGSSDLVIVGKSHPIINLFNTFKDTDNKSTKISNSELNNNTIDARHSSPHLKDVAIGVLSKGDVAVPSAEDQGLFTHNTIAGGSSTAKKLLSFLPPHSITSSMSMVNLKSSMKSNSDDDLMSEENWKKYDDDKYILGWLGGIMRRNNFSASLLVISKGKSAPKNDNETNAVDDTTSNNQ